MICDLNTCPHITDLERELRQAKIALGIAVQYCECATGERGPLVGCSIAKPTWDWLVAIASSGGKGHA